MAVSAWPFDLQDVSETQFSQWASMLRGSGVSAAADFKVSVASGLGLSSAAGTALVRGYAVYDAASEALAVGAADATARIDRVVLEVDPATNSAVRKVVEGTAGSGVPPALVQTVAGIFQLPLCLVAVGANAVNLTAGNVTDDRVLIGVAWGDVSGKPSTFSPSAHTHVWGDVSGKPSTFSPSAHTHVSADVSDATTVGAALLTASSAIAAREAIRFFKGTGPGSPSVDDLRYRDV
jgi:hypothetical protein